MHVWVSVSACLCYSEKEREREEEIFAFLCNCRDHILIFKTASCQQVNKQSRAACQAGLLFSRKSFEFFVSKTFCF